VCNCIVVGEYLQATVDSNSVVSVVTVQCHSNVHPSNGAVRHTK
jgi:hypothetical protein